MEQRYYTLSPKDTRIISEEKKSIRDRGCGQLKGICVLDTVGWLHIWAHIGSDPMHKTCQTQARPNFNMDRETEHEVLPAVKELSAVSRSRDRKY